MLLLFLFFTYEYYYLTFAELSKIITTYLNPFLFSSSSNKSSIPRNWLKITTLSSCFKVTKCSFKAIIFVLKNTDWVSFYWSFFIFNLFYLGKWMKSSLRRGLLQKLQKPFSSICRILQDLQKIWRQQFMTGSWGWSKQIIQLSKLSLAIFSNTSWKYYSFISLFVDLILIS